MFALRQTDKTSFYFFPVDPKPPSPRSVSGSSDASTACGKITGNVTSWAKRRFASWHRFYFFPVDPKPPSPRSVSGSSDASTACGKITGRVTSWAKRRFASWHTFALWHMFALRQTDKTSFYFFPVDPKPPSPRSVSGSSDASTACGKITGNVTSRAKRRFASWHSFYFFPVDPKPPSPRSVSGSSDASTACGKITGRVTSWANRSPGSNTYGSLPWFISGTIISPR